MKANLMDVGAERAVLASLMNHGLEAYVEISDIISSNSFADKNNKLIYLCMAKVLENQSDIDLPSILAAASQLNLIESINNEEELEYLRNLELFPSKKETVGNFALQLKKYEFARSIQTLSTKIAKDVENIKGDESIGEIMSIVESPLTDFLRQDNTGNKPVRIGDSLDEYLDYIESNPCKQIGISTGYPAFDEAIGGGLRRKCVDLVSARPKVGKSIFADNVALHVAQQGIPVLMIDTEMSTEDHINRMMANLSDVQINDIATGMYVEDEFDYMAVSSARPKLREIPYHYINVSNEPFENIINIIKRWIIQEVGQDENGNTNECLVIYDYLKLMSSTSITNNIQEYQALGFQITSLHNLTVKYDFPCLTFAQLNRDGITREGTDVVSGSDRLIWLCTSFSIFKIKSDEERAEDGYDAGNRKLVPVVCRHGAGMSDGNYINLNLNESVARMEEIGTRDFLLDQQSRGIPGTDEALEDLNG